MRRLWGMLLIVGLAAPVLGTGSWSLTAPAFQSSCWPAAIGPVHTTITSGGSPSKEAYAFANEVSGDGETLYCDFAFPRSAGSASVSVNLTTQQGVSGQGPCWQARWEISRPGQSWGANTSLAAPPSHVNPTIPTANTDVRVSIPITATDQVGTTCAVGGATNTCAGSHGLLAITRLPQSSCPGTLSNPSLLTRIEITGTTP